MNVSEQIIEVINAISTQVGEGLNKAAVELGVAVEYIYPILLKQARIDGVMGIVSIFGLLAFSIISVYMCLYFCKKVDTCDSDMESIYVGLVIIFGFFILFSMVAFFFELGDLKTHITALLNPDWYIAENLLKQFIK